MTREFDSFDAIQTANFGFVVTLADAETAEKYAYKTGIEDTIKRVLEIIEGHVESRFYPDGGADYVIENVEGLIDAVEALKG